VEGEALHAVEIVGGERHVVEAAAEVGVAVLVVRPRGAQATGGARFDHEVGVAERLGDRHGRAPVLAQREIEDVAGLDPREAIDVALEEGLAREAELEVEEAEAHLARGQVVVLDHERAPLGRVGQHPSRCAARSPRLASRGLAHGPRRPTQTRTR
jgi:hypothetical protein